jgi:uncharacterized protein YlxW (UPF0749 family)
MSALWSRLRGRFLPATGADAPAAGADAPAAAGGVGSPARPEGGERWRGFVPDLLTEMFENPLDPGYADAARRRAERAERAEKAEPSARREPPVRPFPVPRALTLLVVAGIGFLLIVAYQHVLDDEPARSRARDGLVDQINDRRAGTDALLRRADQLRDQVARQRDAVLDDRAAARLRDLEATTGLGRVTGDGVVVRIADAPRPVDAVTGQGSGNDLGRVLDRDLQQIANALWRAGAEAIAVNGQRLISTSTIRAAGDAILVDFRPLTGPYEVTAIGPGDLQRQFANSPTARAFRQLVDAFGMSFEVRKRDHLSLPAASDPQLRYARPLRSASPSPTTVTPTEGGR